MTFAVALWHRLLDLPPGIGSAIASGLFTCAAAFFAFVGVALSLWAHRWRERVAREHEMRREAYFAFAGSLHRMFEFIRQIAMHQLSEADLRSLIKDYSADCSKLHLVGDLESLKSLYRLDEKLQEAMAALGIKRAEVLTLKSRHDAINRNLSEAVDRMKKFRPIGTAENADAIAQSGITWRNLLQLEWAISVDIRRKTLDIHREANKYMTEMIPLRIGMFLAARKSLAFKIDEKAYSEETKKSYECRNAGLAELCDKVEASLNIEDAAHHTTAQKPKE